MATTVIVAGMLFPWTLRNWLIFNEFQPLAPRYFERSKPKETHEALSVTDKQIM